MLVIPYTPRGPSPLAPIVFALGFASGLITGTTAPARADAPAILGFRIEMRACRANECRDIPIKHPAAQVGGLYACQVRADTVQALVDSTPPERLTAVGLGNGEWTIRARCVPVRGDARA